MSEVCGGCQLAIQDQFMLHVLNKSWHSTCLLCADCKVPQTESCFFRDGMILCKNDFTRRFGTRCAGCEAILEKEDLVRRARDLVFHVNCFKCSMCQKTLDTGEQLYVIGSNKFICKDDYLAASVGSEECISTDEVDENVHDEDDDSTDVISPDRHFNESAESHNGLLELEPSTAGSGDDKNGDDNSLSTKRRGPRTTIKSKQLETLKAAFSSTPKPTRHMREQLAAETGLNMRVIQVWFQNRRSKERRMKASRIAFRTPRRNRQNGALRSDDMNSIFSEVLDPMQQHDPAGFYAATGMPPPPGFFNSGAEQLQLYSQNNSLPLQSGSTLEQLDSMFHKHQQEALQNAFPKQQDNMQNVQLEALAAAVQVSTGEYHLEEALLQASNGVNGSVLSVW